MGNEELMVTIPVKRFEELIAIETGARIVKGLAMKTRYGVEPNEIARLLTLNYQTMRMEGKINEEITNTD